MEVITIYFNNGNHNSFSYVDDSDKFVSHDDFEKLFVWIGTDKSDKEERIMIRLKNGNIMVLFKSSISYAEFSKINK